MEVLAALQGEAIASGTAAATASLLVAVDWGTEKVLAALWREE